MNTRTLKPTPAELEVAATVVDDLIAQIQGCIAELDPQVTDLDSAFEVQDLRDSLFPLTQAARLMRDYAENR